MRAARSWREAWASPEGWFATLGFAAAFGAAAVPEFITFAGDSGAVRRACYSTAAMFGVLGLLLVLLAHRKARRRDTRT